MKAKTRFETLNAALASRKTQQYMTCMEVVVIPMCIPILAAEVDWARLVEMQRSMATVQVV